MEPRDSILLRIHRLTNDVYFVGTRHTMVFLLVMTNTSSLNIPKKQKYHTNAVIIGTSCLRGRSREHVSEKLDKIDS
jgi:hypothetical protein